MKCIFLILISITSFSIAHAEELSIISDSSQAVGSHTLHYTGSQIERALRCDHINIDFIDPTPEFTQVRLDLGRLQAPNLMMKDHSAVLTLNGVDEEVCTVIEDIKVNWHKMPNIEFAFKVYQGVRRSETRFLREDVEVYLTPEITLISRRENVLF